MNQFRYLKCNISNAQYAQKLQISKGSADSEINRKIILCEPLCS